MAIFHLSIDISMIILKLRYHLPERRRGEGVMEEKIKKVLAEKVDPVLASHFGGVVLSAIEDGVVYVKLTGSCSTCPSAQYTIEDVVKEIVLQEVPEVHDVVLDTSVSEDLLDMARKILNKEKL